LADDRAEALSPLSMHKGVYPIDRSSYGPDALWPGEEWLYLAGPGPARFLKVVVHYEHGEGRIVTAFPRRAFP